MFWGAGLFKEVPGQRRGGQPCVWGYGGRGVDREEREEERPGGEACRMVVGTPRSNGGEPMGGLRYFAVTAGLQPAACNGCLKPLELERFSLSRRRCVGSPGPYVS